MDCEFCGCSAGIENVACILENRGRLGGQIDYPEGESYIKISDGLANEMAQAIREHIALNNQDLPTLTEGVEELKEFKMPFCCPVCDGRCFVEYGFYGGSGGRNSCRSCNGTGIVWG